MAPPAAPPEPPTERPQGPRQVKADPPRPKAVEEPVRTPPVANAAVALPTPPAEPTREEADEPVAETSAPASRPAAATPSSHAPSWQAQVLGQLNRVKRYPSTAQARRQQGVPYVRFVMDREGRVLSSRLERSSGFRALDDEAVALPGRAQPLPGPPESVPGHTLELVVPVEFFLRR
nr:TonB family protein [Sandaracinobacteroides sayramensis]